MTVERYLAATSNFVYLQTVHSPQPSINYSCVKHARMQYYNPSTIKQKESIET